MKKFIMFLMFALLEYTCIAQNIMINDILRKGIQYYFEDVIPLYYQGKLDDTNARNELHRKYKIGMQGTNDGGLHFFGQDDDNMIFNFYYLIDHNKQSIQCIMLSSTEINNYLYEYWIFQMSDRGSPYRYAYFYLTKADSKESKRKIVNVSKKYMDYFETDTGQIIDFSIKNLVVLYTIEPWITTESFINTRYEDVIVKFRKNKPYCRKINWIEKASFKLIRKSNR